MLSEIHEVMGHDEGLTLAFILGSMGILAGTIISVTTVLVTQWRMVRESEDATSLKHFMLERGMTSDEIATVVEASSRSTFARRRSRERGTTSYGGERWHAGAHGEQQPVA